MFPHTGVLSCGVPKPFFENRNLAEIYSDLFADHQARLDADMQHLIGAVSGDGQRRSSLPMTPPKEPLTARGGPREKDESEEGESEKERWEPIPWDGAMRESWREDDSRGESEDGVGFFEGDGERGEGSDRER